MDIPYQIASGYHLFLEVDTFLEQIMAIPYQIDLLFSSVDLQQNINEQK